MIDMTMDDFAPKLQPIKVLLQVPEQTLSWASAGPYAIAITSLIAACAAIYAIKNTNKQNNENRLHDKKLKHHEFIVDKFEEINSLILELEEWQLEFFNYAPGIKENYVVMPFPQSLMKAKLIARLYFPNIEDDIESLAATCDIVKLIYFKVTPLIMKIKKGDTDWDRYQHLMDKFQSINNVPIHVLYKSIAPHEVKALCQDKSNSEILSLLKQADIFYDEKNIRLEEMKVYYRINNLHNLISDQCNSLIDRIYEEAKIYSSSFATTMEK